MLVANLKLADLRHPDKPLSLEVLTQWLAERAQLPYVKVDPMKIDVAAVTQVVSHGYANRYRILPIAVSPMQVVFATSEPFDTRWIADLGHVLRKDIQRVVANPLDVGRYLAEWWGVQRSIQRAKDAKSDLNDGRAILNFEQLVELGKGGELGADDRHVVHIVDWLLQYAFEQRASDIHLEPRRDSSPIRFRIDGVMHKVFELPTPVMTAVTSRIKILGRMDVAEKRRPQDGRIKTRSQGGREVELRLSSMPTAFGEKVVMRIFDPDIVVKEFRQLGFTPDEEKIWRDLVERPHGIVLVTGPTGSGKTTTLYSTLKVLATPDINVCTVEDPIEMVSPEFNQMQVHQAIDLDFATGVRTLLRQDPGHHHDRRDPRSRNRADGRAGVADRASRALDAAHQRCAERADAPARSWRAALSDPVDADRRRRAAPRAHALPALQDRSAARRAGLGRADAPLASARRRRRSTAEGLPRMPQDRLPRPHRHLRDAARHAADPRDDPGEHGSGAPDGGGLRRRHASAARVGCRAGRARDHDDRTKSSTCCRRRSSRTTPVSRAMRAT